MILSGLGRIVSDISPVAMNQLAIFLKIISSSVKLIVDSDAPFNEPILNVLELRVKPEKCSTLGYKW